MNTSLSWIKKYVPDLDVSAQEYTDAMTLSGTKVEGFEELDADLEKIVIGQIEKIERHPDADKLIVCQVNIGTETVQIVTGASNVHEGDKIPVVLDGGSVAGGTKIKTGKLRGVESCGMMCSIEELGSTTEFYPEAAEDGIYIFPEDAEVGASAIEALGFHDVVFEYEITSNRVDCYSVIGIAREAAATFQKPFYPPVVEVKGNSEDVNDYVKVTVEDKDLCPRYCARMVKNVKIGPSPKWMQRCLAANGIRPINNLVDITNYVMEEFGQPMHAYDMDTIEGQEIIVRRAQKDEKFVTLDGQERVLDDSILMICDGKKPVGIAGIMGGENSMITEKATTVLLEAACFDGVNIRLSSKKVGLRTDASGKFEKGLDPNNAQAAIDRACQLIEEFGCGEVVGGMADVYSKVKEPVRVAFDADKINSLLGTELSKEEMLEYLSRVELKYDESTGEIVAPTFRHDIFRIADLAEEVARFYGYEQFKDKSLFESMSKNISLLMALKLKKINVDIFEKNLVEFLERDKKSVDRDLLGSLNSKKRRADINIEGLLPCPIRIPLLEAFESWLNKNRKDLAYTIGYDLRSANMGLDWIKEEFKRKDIEKIPDILMSAGFDLFFDKELVGEFIEGGYFEAITDELNKDFDNDYIDLKDPKNRYLITGLVPAVFLINKKQLGERKIPQTWEDILGADFEESVAIPMGDLDLFNAIILNIYKEYGKEGISKLARSYMKNLHPAEMVKSRAKNTQDIPAVSIIPYFFTKMIDEDKQIAVWPKDGAIISPIFMIAKKEKREELKPIVDFFLSREVAEIFSSNGKFPSTNKDIDNNLKEDQKFKWVGWDFIEKEDIASLLKELEEKFNAEIMK